MTFWDEGPTPPTTTPAPMQGDSFWDDQPQAPVPVPAPVSAQGGSFWDEPAHWAEDRPAPIVTPERGRYPLLGISFLPEIEVGTPILGGLSKAFYQVTTPTTPEHLTAPIRDIPLIGGLSRVAEAPINILTEASRPFEGALIATGTLAGLGLGQALGKRDIETPAQYLERQRQYIREAGKEGDIVGALSTVAERAPLPQQIAASFGSPVYSLATDFGISKVLRGAAAAAHVKPVGNLNFLERALLGVPRVAELSPEQAFRRGGIGKGLLAETPVSAARAALVNMADNFGARINQATEGMDAVTGINNLSELANAFKAGKASEYLPLTEGAFRSKVGQQITLATQKFDADDVLKRGMSAIKLLNAPEFPAISEELLKAKGITAKIRVPVVTSGQPEAAMIEELGKHGAIFDPLADAARQMAGITEAVDARRLTKEAAQIAAQAVKEEAARNVLTATKATLYSEFLKHVGAYLETAFPGVKYVPAVVKVVGGMPRVVEGAGFAKASPTRADNFFTSLKSLQSAIVLGLNPYYAVRNFWNNLSTMAARGSLGYWTPERSAALMRELGVDPLRFAQGFTIAGERGGFGFQGLAARIEAWSSRVAFSEGAHKAKSQMMREGVGWQLSKESREALRAIDPRLERQVIQTIERYGLNRVQAEAKIRALFANPSAAPALIDLERALDELNRLPEYASAPFSRERAAELWTKVDEFFKDVKTPQEFAAARARAEAWLQARVDEAARLSASRSKVQVPGMVSPKEIDLGLGAETPLTAGARPYTETELAALKRPAPAAAPPAADESTDEAVVAWLRAMVEGETAPAAIRPKGPQVTDAVRKAVDDANRLAYEAGLVRWHAKGVQAVWRDATGVAEMPNTTLKMRQFAAENPEAFAAWTKRLQDIKDWQTFTPEQRAARLGVKPDAKGLTAKSIPAKYKEAWYGKHREAAAREAAAKATAPEAKPVTPPRVSPEEMRALREEALQAGADRIDVDFASTPDELRRLIAAAKEKTPEPVLGYSRAQFHKELDEAAADLTEKQRDAIKAIWDARARQAVYNGESPTVDAYYAKRLTRVERVRAAEPGLKQPARGMVDFDAEGRAVLKLFEESDVSTLAHESAHIFLFDLDPKDLDIVARWAFPAQSGEQLAENLYAARWTVLTMETHQKFARAFERYLAEGVAPTPELRGIFEQFKEWLLAIYKKITGSYIDVDVSPQIRDVFDRLLAAKEIAEAKSAWIAAGKAEYLKGARGAGAILKEEFLRSYFMPTGEAVPVWLDTATGDWRPIGKGTILGKQATFKKPGPEWVKRPGSEVAGWADRVMEKAREELPEGIIGRESTIDDLQALAQQTRAIRRGAGKTAMQEALEQASGAGAMQDFAVKAAETDAKQIRVLMAAVERAADFGKPQVVPRVMPEVLKDDLARHIFPALNDVKIAAVKMGEFYRDAALLNYEKRYGWNAFISMVFPYEFWLERSALHWAEYFADNPGMLALYADLRDLLHAKQQEQDYPSRFRGAIKVPLPFVPQWLGGGVGFVDPLNALLPLEQMTAPMRNLRYTLAGKRDIAMRVRQMVASGEISEAEGELAIKTGKGRAWDLARESVQRLDANPLDVASLAANPYVPIDWIWKMMTGRPDEIRGLLPIASPIQSATAVARETGVRGIPPGGINIDPVAWFKEKLFGAPYDPWQNYRVDRMLVSMVADGVITEREARLAMIERAGAVFDQAVQRAALEQAVPTLTGLTGFRAKVLPPGELKTERGWDEYGAFVDDLVRGLGRDPAQMPYEEKKAFLKERGVYGKVGEFFEKHPELSASIARGREPEARLRDFYQNEIWEQYNKLSELDKRMVRAANPDLAKMFISKETRVDINQIPLLTLAKWTYYLKGYTPRAAGEVLGAPPELGGLGLPQIVPQPKELSDAYRKWLERHKQIAAAQEQYYSLPEGAERRAFLAQHPELKEYFEWNAKFWAEHPQLARLLGREQKGEPPARPAPREGGARGGWSPPAYPPRPAPRAAPVPDAWESLRTQMVGDRELLEQIEGWLALGGLAAEKYAKERPRLAAWLKNASVAYLAALRAAYNRYRARFVTRGFRIYPQIIRYHKR